MGGHMRPLLMGLVMFSVTGCATYDYAVSEYGDTPLVQFEHADRPFRIFDKHAAGKLMITPSLGDAADDGLFQGLTFGIVNTHPSEPLMHKAAAAYLTSTGRTCMVQTGYVIMQPEWEFRYQCEAKAQ